MIPKIIYLFWHDNKIPFFIKKCIQNIKRKNPDYKVIIFHYDDVMKIKNRPKVLEEYKRRGVADWLRLYLLNKYGGVWLDISCIFHKKNLNDIIDLNTNKLQAFESPFNQKEIMIENWFLASMKNNKLVRYWLKEWEIALQNKEKYVKKNIKYASNNLKNFLPYLTQHLIFVKLLKTTDLEKCFKSLGYADEKNNPFYYHKRFSWNMDTLAKFLLTQKKLNDDLLFIKLRGEERYKLIQLIKKYKFSRKSKLIKLLNII